MLTSNIDQPIHLQSKANKMIGPYKMGALVLNGFSKSNKLVKWIKKNLIC